MRQQHDDQIKLYKEEMEQTYVAKVIAHNYNSTSRCLVTYLLHVWSVSWSFWLPLKALVPLFISLKLLSISAGERPSVIRDEQLFSQYGPRGAAGVHAESWESGHSTRKPAERGMSYQSTPAKFHLLYIEALSHTTVEESKVPPDCWCSSLYFVFTCYIVLVHSWSSLNFHLILSDILQEVTQFWLTNICTVTRS